MIGLLFFAKCLGIGLIATLGVGPISILIFNRSSMYGFWKGVITALGSSIADSLLFLCGLLGVLSFFSEWKHSFLLMDLIGGIFLIAMGCFYWFKKVRIKDLRPKGVTVSSNSFLIPIKAFFVTALNPMGFVYFTFWSTQLFPNKYIALSSHELLIACVSVFVGSFSGLVLVALLSSLLGEKISGRRLVRVTHVTGILFVIFGLYFLYDFSMHLMKAFN